MGSFPYVIRVFVVCHLTVRREYFFSVSALTALSSGCLILLREGDTIVRILQHTDTITSIQRRDANIFIGDTAGNITFLYFFQILENMPFEEWTVEEVAELIAVIGSPTAAAAILESRVDGRTLMAPNFLTLLSADCTPDGLNLNPEQCKWLLTEINKRRKDTTHTPEKSRRGHQISPAEPISEIVTIGLL